MKGGVISVGIIYDFSKVDTHVENWGDRTTVAKIDDHLWTDILEERVQEGNDALVFLRVTIFIIIQRVLKPLIFVREISGLIRGDTVVYIFTKEDRFVSSSVAKQKNYVVRRES